jgi:hypothetical protein
MRHWKNESLAVGFFHDPGLVNPNLVDSHAAFSLFGTGRRGWQGKFLLSGALCKGKKNEPQPTQKTSRPGIRICPDTSASGFAICRRSC